jgi:uncharacterized protein (TIGR02452 family)
MDIYYKRIQIYENTQKTANKFFNNIPESIKYNNESLDKEIKEKEKCNYNTIVQVLQMDTLDALKLLSHKESGCINPVVLNMANPSHPGGGVEGGASAQEENIFRRTNYFLTLKMSFYPILNSDTIYSSGVTRFRSSEETGYIFEEPQKICIIACPSVRHPELTQQGLFKNNHDLVMQYEKICNIFKTAIANGHDSIVLSAFGCGAFRCPPEEVAGLFKKALDIYGHYFKRVIFAIKQPVDDQSKNNYKIFEEILNTKK